MNTGWLALALAVALLSGCVKNTDTLDQESQGRGEVLEGQAQADPPGAQHATAMGHYEQGLALFDNKDLDGAISSFTEAIRLDPGHPKAYTNRGTAYLLKGDQAEGHAYGKYTERDLLLWARETEKLVVEGSRIFHDGAALGSTVGVSCDMCHPHAANTHPETYPKFQAQMGRVALLRDMINWCIENPVRGHRLEADDATMRALEAYIYAQRTGTELAYGKH